MEELSKINRERFDLSSEDWDANSRRQQLAKAVFTAMTQEAPLEKSINVLEFGCGTGLITVPVSRKVGSLTAWDVSEKMLGQLKQKKANLGLENVTLKQEDIMSFSGTDKFDLILSSMTLHHIGDTSNLFRRLFELLNPGGRIVLADLDKEDGTFHNDSKGVAHFGFDRKEVENKLEKTGFTKIRFRDALEFEKEGPGGESLTYSVFAVAAEKPLC